MLIRWLYLVVNTGTPNSGLSTHPIESSAGSTVETSRYSSCEVSMVEGAWGRRMRTRGTRRWAVTRGRSRRRRSSRELKLPRIAEVRETFKRKIKPLKEFHSQRETFMNQRNFKRCLPLERHQPSKKK